MADLREARLEDAEACAAMLNAWIDATDWMPRIHTPQDVERHYRTFVLVQRKVFVLGDPVRAFIALDMDEGYITALYASRTGLGWGKILMDHAKTQLSELRLWTHEANVRAHAFYAREGFMVIDRTEGDNEEKIPDRLYQWKLSN